jgi:hypothetical protein
MQRLCQALAQGNSIADEGLTHAIGGCTCPEDLQTTLERLQTTLEGLQSTLEKLQTTLEKLQTTLEELQTTLEELQTTLERLQSTLEGRMKPAEAEEVCKTDTHQELFTQFRYFSRLCMRTPRRDRRSSRRGAGKGLVFTAANADILREDMNMQRAAKPSIPALSCGIYRLELEKILPEIQAELGAELAVNYLPPGLDVNETRLAEAIKEGLRALGGKPALLLYGRMCHTDMAGITLDTGVIYPRAANCVEAFLSPEKKQEMDATGNVYYLTMSGLKFWREIYQQGHGWEAADARVNFGFFDKIVVLDCGLFEITDEALFDFFEFTQVPVEVMPISLGYFKGVVLGICRKLLGSQAAPIPAAPANTASTASA